MTMQSEELQPEEFGQAAQAVIAALQGQGPAEAAAAMADAGLFGICADEAQGGLGLPLAFAMPVVRVAGQMQLSYPLPEQIAASKALQGTEAGGQLLRGEKSLCVVMAAQAAGDWSGVARNGLLADYVLVQTDAGFALYDKAALRCQAEAMLDPEVPQLWVSTAGATPLLSLDAQQSQAFCADTKLLWAEYVNGMCAGALERTADYLQARVQFGRPLSAKQAVRHHLARMRLLLEASSAQAWRALRTDEWGNPRQADSALAAALNQGAWVLEKAIHLHGGMGFTWELGLHRSLRELKKLDACMGAGAVMRAVGADFIDRCEVTQ
ncbi:acyl-CoA dehydrogenase family protein [Comamonas sp. MYb396]|uniref:acyl-CoA dehydrogenase family protein n=1 Tax=Comamonas sp. MYb396 TaxID=2745302 RepID=UPI0030B68CAB